MNSLPLSKTHLRSLRYLDHQTFSNCSETCFIVLFWMRKIFIRFVTGSIHVSALKRRFFPLGNLNVQGLIRLIWASSQWPRRAFLGGKCPYLQFAALLVDTVYIWAVCIVVVAWAFGSCYLLLHTIFLHHSAQVPGDTTECFCPPKQLEASNWKQNFREDNNKVLEKQH